MAISQKTVAYCGLQVLSRLLLPYLSVLHHGRYTYVEKIWNRHSNQDYYPSEFTDQWIFTLWISRCQPRSLEPRPKSCRKVFPATRPILKHKMKSKTLSIAIASGDKSSEDRIGLRYSSETLTFFWNQAGEKLGTGNNLIFRKTINMLFLPIILLLFGLILDSQVTGTEFQYFSTKSLGQK